MKILSFDARPLSLTYSALIYNTETGTAEYMGPISTDYTKIINLVLDKNVDSIQIYGNHKYTQKIKERLDKELQNQFSNYSNIPPVQVELKGVMK